MGWHNPPYGWGELERRMSGRAPIADGATAHNHRPRYVAPELEPPTLPNGEPEPVVPYAELHVHSAYSFLDGASMPEQLVEEAVRLRLEGIAITDHDGFYGAVRFAEAALAHGMPSVYGAELSLGLRAPQNGIPDPEGTHLLVLARGTEGYHRLSKAITRAQLEGDEKGRPVYDLDALGELAEGHWAVLSGCRKGTVRQALETHGRQGATRELRGLVERFGRDNVYVELTDRGDPLDSERNDALAGIARDLGLPILATGNVHYARPDRAPLATALAAVRSRASLDQHEPWLPAAGSAYLRSGYEMAQRFARYPGALETSVALARETAFELRSATPRLPRLPVPDGMTLMEWLAAETWAGAWRIYGDPLPEGHRQRLQSELDVIAAKDFPGYFLLVKDIVDFARSRGILCQGRGSAASSAVCYVIGVTPIDAIFYDLPFERFLSSIRDEEPDIDVDFDSDRREEVIQYVYETYGRENAAQVANVVSYTPRNAIRDMAKALGHGPGQQDAWSKRLERWGDPVEEDLHDIPDGVKSLTAQLMGMPRHLGIHSGGMVITERPIGEVVPVERARMAGRTVLQWEKDDCAWMGLVKFDLLGLGMLSALQHSFDQIRASFGREWTLSSIPKEEQATYDALCRADAIGVFQVESRAQMGLLPRLQPRAFYDLVIQVALIRPGPIQGGAVHPFVRRKLGQEQFEFLHPDLEPILGKTFGVPVFQEQVIKIARDLGGLTPEDADLLRRSLGSKRGKVRISGLREKLEEGLRAKGIDDTGIATIYGQIEAFSNFGFAESHALSFALLVYASSWLKLHYPAAFLAGLLRAQPMGFYSPATLTADARRHGVEVRRPDILRSGVFAVLEPLDEAPGTVPETGLDECLALQPEVPVFDPTAPDAGSAHRRDGGTAVRLGLAGVRGIGETVATRIVAERERRGAFASMEDLVRRTGLTTAQLEALASADAFLDLGLARREALWRAGAAAGDRAEFLPSTVVAVQPPLFPDPTSFEVLRDDLWATGISVDDHPVAHLRSALDERGILPSSALRVHEAGRRVEVAGLVTHRQRPGTASGMTFMNLEDEHGWVNVICSVGVWKRYRRIARESPALVVRGILERSPEGVTNLVADAFEPLTAGVLHRSRDFQ